MGLQIGTALRNTARNIAQNMNLSNTKGALNNFIDKPSTQKVVSALTDPKALATVILLETTVTGGRTYQAHKRGGKTEARERLFEESLSAIVWLFGVDTLNKIQDKLFKKYLKVDTAIDFGGKSSKTLSEGLEDPIKRITKGRSKEFKNKLMNLKLFKYITSVVVATTLVGVIIPKINQAITKKRLSPKLDDKNKPVVPTNQSITPKFDSMQSFLAQTKDKNISFKGIPFLSSGIKTIGNALENNNICKLLTIDVPLTTGRTVNARNKDERIEILFRDIVSAFFYMASTPIIITGLSKLFDKKLGIATNLRPAATKHLTDEVINNPDIFNKNEMSVKELRAKLLGTQYPDGVKQVESLFKNKLSLSSVKLEELLSMGVNANLLEKYASLNKQHTISERLKYIANSMEEKASQSNSKEAKLLIEYINNTSDRLYKMTNKGVIVDINSQINNIYKMIENSSDELIKNESTGLLKKLNGMFKVLLGKGFITKEQVSHIVEGGFANDPEFINKIIIKSNPKVIDPKKYVDFEDIQTIKQDAKNYFEKLISSLEKEGDTVTKETFEKIVTKVKNKTMLAKMGYATVGLTISAAFLSYIIPKTQYWITKKRTGSNEFPGVKEFEQNKEVK